MSVQIVHHENWFRDFVIDMSRRGPTHLRDMPQHCPKDNTDNLFDWATGGAGQRREHLKTIDKIDKNKPFVYMISIDGCDEETLENLVYYGRELLLQDLVRSPISDEARNDLNTNPKAFLVIANTAEGHASNNLFNTLHTLVALLNVPFDKVYYGNSTSNLQDCYNNFFLNREFATKEKLNVFGAGCWTEIVCQQMLVDTYNLEQNDNYCEFGNPFEPEQTKHWSIDPIVSSFLNDIQIDIHRPHLFMYKHMNAKRGHRTMLMSMMNEKGLLQNNMFSTPSSWDATYFSGEAYLRKSFFDKRKIETYNKQLKKLEHLKDKVPTNIDRDTNNLDFDPNTNFSSDQVMYFNARRNCDIEVIGESEFDGSVFITEKFFKAVLFKQPFIIVGSAGSLQRIRQMGYQTFSPVINEGYDSNDDKLQRCEMICEELERLSYIKKDPEKWREWYRQIKPMILQNYNTFVNNLRKEYEIRSFDTKVERTGDLQRVIDEIKIR